MTATDPDVLIVDPPVLEPLEPTEPPPVRVLALDLSLTATGIAHPDGTLATFAPGGAGLGDRRLVAIRDYVGHLAYAHEPTVVAVEGPVTRSQAATVIGMVHGAVRVVLLDLGVPYLLVPPAVLKLYATGKGNAPKPDMRMALYRRTGIDEPDDNRVDAAWLRHLALDLAGHAEVVMPQHHRTALDKVDMPGGVYDSAHYVITDEGRAYLEQRTEAGR